MIDPQTDLFTDTRQEAKAHIEKENRAGTLRYECLLLLKKQPLTADECAKKLHESPLAIRPRITELKNQGTIRDTGARRENKSGVKAKVWEAV